MSYLSVLLWSLGLGFSSVHTDFNSQPLTPPKLLGEVGITAMFNRQSISLNYSYYQGTMPISKWAQSYTGASVYDISNQVISLQVGGGLFDFQQNGAIYLESGLAYGSNTGLGFGGSMIYRCPLDFKNLKAQWYVKGDLYYWALDELEGYVNHGDVIGDFEARFNLGMCLPIGGSGYRLAKRFIKPRSEAF